MVMFDKFGFSHMVNFLTEILGHNLRLDQKTSDGSQKYQKNQVRLIYP